MSSPAIILIPLLGLVVPALAVTTLVLVVLAARSRRVPHDPERAVRDHLHAVRAGTWLVGATLPVVALPVVLLVTQPAVADPDAGTATVGLLLVSAPLALVVALGFLGVHALGQATWPAPSGSVRRASLAPRRTPALGPRRLLVLAVAWAGLLVLALLAGAATASGPASLRVPHSRPVGGTQVVELLTPPWPGPAYAAGMATVLVLVLLALAGALAAGHRRPAAGDPDGDATHRWLSACRVLRGTQAALAATLALVLAGAGAALLGSDAAATGTALLVAAGAVALSGVVALALPVPEPAPDGRRAPAGLPAEPPARAAG